MLVGMLSKDYQDMCFQQATGVSADSEVKYHELRDKTMNIANQRMSMITPTSMDIDAVNQPGRSGPSIWSAQQSQILA